MTIQRSITTFATVVAVALLTCLTAGAAQAKLPVGKATIVPNVGIGGLRLGAALRPFPRGWAKPTRCVSQEGVDACAWAAKGRSAFPPAGATGISGPFLLAMAQDGKVGMITINPGDRDADPRALRRYKTRDGIGFSSTPEQLQRAYPVVKGRLRDQWVLWGRGNATRTNFRFADGRLAQIEIHECALSRSCSRTPDMD